MTTPHVTFIVPVRDDATRLARCLASIRANTYPADHVDLIVADNGSADDSIAVARRAGARVLILPGVCVAELRNRAAWHAGGSILCFVDSDHEIDRQWIGAAVDALADRGVDAAGAPYHSPEGGTWVQRAYGGLRVHADGRHEVDWVGSGNLAITRAAFERIGGFDAALESCEDVDLCQRLRRSGGRIVSDSELRTIHHGDPRTLGSLFRSELWRARNNLRTSVRAPFSWRAVPSIAIPVIDLLSLAAIVAGLAVASATVTLAAIVVFVGLTTLRACRIVTNLRILNPVQLAQALSVAATYDLARAIALVARAPHYRRALAIERPSIAIE